ncbi:AMP-binding protein [Pseudomonas sp. MDT1-17]
MKYRVPGESAPQRYCSGAQGACISYQTLNRQTTQLARFLRSGGAKTATHIAIIGDRFTTLIVSELAILKCGVVYVPLDTKTPQARQRWMMRDSQVQILLTLKSLDIAELESVFA